MEVKGPYWDRANRFWTLKWRESPSDSWHSASNDEKGPLQAKRKQLRGAEADSGGAVSKYLPELPDDFDGSANAFKQALVAAARAANGAARDNATEALGTVRKYASSLSEIAHAIVPHAGYLELEHEFAALLAYVESFQRGKRDAAQPQLTTRINQTLAGRPRPPSTVH